MEMIAVVSLLVAIEYFVLAILVGKCRGETGIAAPATTGNEKFERVFRVQQNTMEQLVIFYPALWIFAYYVSQPVGAGLGLVFLVGRIMYARGYMQSPDKRGPGFAIGSLALVVLMLGGLVGAGLQISN